MSVAPKTDPVEVLVANVRAGEPPTMAELSAVQSVMRLWLARRGLAPEDLDEVSAEAVTRLVDAVRLERLDLDRPAGAWLRVVADRLALDVLKRSRRSTTVSLDDVSAVDALTDDQLAALLDRSAAAADVRAALRAAADAKQTGVVRIVAAWLSLALANGEAPSTREVADLLGVSHMTVQRGLQAFGRRLRP